MKHFVAAFALVLSFGLVLTACDSGLISPEATSTSNDPAAVQKGPPASTPQKGPQNFVAPLSGDQEVPPVETNATGLAKFKLNKAGDALSYKLNVANIEDVTQAHIHCGTADVNGPIFRLS